MKITSHKAPLWASKKSIQLLIKWRSKEIRANRSKKLGYLKIRVSHRWRLLSKDGGNVWELISHSSYNRKIDK